MKIILGTKEIMSQIFDEKGKVYPVTIINAGPVVVTQIKNKEKDGYQAIQVGFGDRKVKNINKAQKGHFADLGNFMYQKEFQISSVEDGMAVGSKIDTTAFSKGDKVRISSYSKGKGFQGVVKRHGFSGGPRTHGQKHSEREAGSIGGGARAGGRVAKGMRMAGRMGGDRITIKGVEIIDIDSENNKIYVKGGVPGRRGTLVEIQG